MSNVMEKSSSTVQVKAQPIRSRISEYWDKFDDISKQEILGSVKATPEIVAKGLQDANRFIRWAAVMSPGATLELAEEGFRDASRWVRAGAVECSAATAELAKKGMKDYNAIVRAAALRGPGVTLEIVLMGVKDLDNNVRELAKERLKDFAPQHARRGNN